MKFDKNFIETNSKEGEALWENGVAKKHSIKDLIWKRYL